MKNVICRLVLIVLSTLGTVNARAEVQINYSDQGNFVRRPDLSLAQVGDLVRLRTFPADFDFAANPSFGATNGAFTEFDSTAVGEASGSGPGQFYDSARIPTNEFVNRQLYLWIFSSNDGSTARAWVIVTNPTWKVPADSGPVTVIDIDMSDVGSIVPSGARGTTDTNKKSANGVDFVMQGPTTEPPPSPTPAPSASPTVTPTPTPPPSPTPSVPPSPSPSASPSPTVSASPSATPSPSALPASHLANISTRLRVGTEDNVLIAGFILQGTGEKRLIVRGIGPSAKGLPGHLIDPVLELYDSENTLLADNDNWQENGNRAEIEESTLAPTHLNEPALLRRLPAAAYTAIVSGKNGTVGNAVVEVYDLDQNGPVQIVNIATRGFVRTDDDVMIGGFFVTGDSPADVVIRAIGPSLTLDNKLADPVLELVDNNGNRIARNDDWKDDQQGAIEASGLEPGSDRESAIRVTLSAGSTGAASYTAIVSGKNGGTGLGVVEVYKLSP